MFREMRRRKQHLSHEECEEVLRAAPRGVLSVIGDDGYPYGVPIDFLYDDGGVIFHSAKAGHKVDALAGCDKACLTVLDEGVPEEGEWWYRFRSVICFGRVRVVTDEDERLDALRAFGRKYFPSEEELEESMSRSADRCLVLEMAIEHMTGKHVKEE